MGMILSPAYAAETVPVFNRTQLAPYQHAKDFSWVTGKLQYVGVYGPSYVIIYEARYQSKYFLFKKKNYLFVPPSQIKDGDYVVLIGSIDRQTRGIFIGDYYLVDKIMLLDEYNQYIKKRSDRS